MTFIFCITEIYIHTHISRGHRSNKENLLTMVALSFNGCGSLEVENKTRVKEERKKWRRKEQLLHFQSKKAIHFELENLPSLSIPSVSIQIHFRLLFICILIFTIHL